MGEVGFDLNEEQALLLEEVRRFGAERIRPGVAERDKAHAFPADLVAELAELGLLGMMVDEAYDGPGMDPLTYALVVEELATFCPALSITMSVTNSVCCWPIQKYGSEALKQRILPELAAGGAIGGFGLTEPGSGSDAGAMKTVARRDGDHYVIDGEKAWITNGGVGKYFVVLARTDPDAGAKGISAIVVPSDAPGFKVGNAEEKLGLRASNTVTLYFDGCRVPVSNLLAEEGHGFRIAMGTLDHSRVGVAAQCLGIHRRALELAVEYAKERVQFGVPIAKHQAIQFKIAEMATELEAARALTYHAATQDGQPHGGRLASQAKLYASEAANRACWQALQIHGGNGFCEDYEIARLYRDVRVTTIYEGTSEMQRMVIARHLRR
ncbi:MAG: acyl-CoA dehydrogenase family protein [Acidobacteriota bacterium]